MKRKVLSFSYCLALLTIIGCGEKQGRPTQTRVDITQTTPAKMSPTQEQIKANQIRQIESKPLQNRSSRGHSALTSGGASMVEYYKKYE